MFHTHLVAAHLLSTSLLKLIFLSSLFYKCFYLYHIVTFPLGETTVHPQIGCSCRLADRFGLHRTVKILLLSWRNWNPSLEKKTIISYCLLEKLLACACRWPAKDLTKKNWILSSFFFFPPGFKMVKAGVKNGGVLRGALSALSSKKERT